MGLTVQIQQKITVNTIGTFATQHDLEVDAMDTLEVTVPAKAGAANGAVDVSVQPGTQVRFIFIKTDLYDEDLTFDVAASGAFPLDGPLLLSGTGPVAQLDSAPTTIAFANARATEAKVTILVGRDA
jgi:hypothetical protein